MSVPSMLSMFMNMPKALPMKLWFPSIDHVTNEPVGVPARVSAQVAVDVIGFTNSSFMPTFWPGTLSSIVILPLPTSLPLHAYD